MLSFIQIQFNIAKTETVAGPLGNRGARDSIRDYKLDNIDI